MASNRGIYGQRAGRSPSELREIISIVKYAQVPSEVTDSVDWESKVKPYINTKAKVTQGKSRKDNGKEADGAARYIVEIRTPDVAIDSTSLILWNGLMLKVNSTVQTEDRRFTQIDATALGTYDASKFTQEAADAPEQLPAAPADPFYTLPD